MKIQIDTEAKTIKLEGSVNLSELIENLEKLFPDNAWKEYKLEPNTDPIVIRQWYPTYIPTIDPVYPWKYATTSYKVTCHTGSSPKTDVFSYN